MKTIVVGGSGFLGSHVADALTEAGHEVTLYDLRPSPHRLPDQRFVHGDILDAEKVKEAFRGQEVVYNFAGLADLDEAHEQPVESARSNVLGNTILLEESRRAKVSRYVFASSIYVAGHAGGFYRASKQACELYVEEYQRWFGLDFTILRFGSIYGRRSDRNNGVGQYLLQALRDRRIVIRGTGEELREYVHVSDVARASVRILEPEFRNQHVILTGHHPLRVRDLAEMIREMVGPDVRIEFQPVDPLQRQEGKTTHYTITPYSFRPQIAKKLVSNYYVDMGQGLIDCLEEMHAALQSPTSSSWEPTGNPR